ncbi:MAG: hypothetical protein ACR2K5_08410 [Pseudolabrys sp.]
MLMNLGAKSVYEATDGARRAGDDPRLGSRHHGAWAKRSQVFEALRLGAHEFRLKPTSPKALQDRLLSIIVKPRPMMQIGEYYVPQPRTLSAGTEPAYTEV